MLQLLPFVSISSMRKREVIALLELFYYISHVRVCVCLANDIAKPHPNMNIKVSAFTVTKKFYNIPFKLDTYSLDCLIFLIVHIICRVDWLKQFGIQLNVSSITQDHTVWPT